MTTKGIELIKSFEGFEANAYWDATGKVWTIGYGATFYMDGSKVKQGDRITKEEATLLLDRMVSEKFEKYVDQYVTSNINPYQHDALTSFAYNCGGGNLKRSTLLKKVNANPSDPSIRDEFAKWNKSGGKVLNGLVRRRKAEADLYFTEYKCVEPIPEETADTYEEPCVVEEEKKNDDELPVIVETNGYGQEEPSVVEVEAQEPWYKRLFGWIMSLFR